ncbi:MAG: hypothetical protein U9N41_03005 [Euryarchaeota archaeon]|nr:hypothetical protein [Euryarchaeota archaeon]
MQQLVEEERKKKEETEGEKSRSQEALHPTVEGQKRDQKEEEIEETPQPLVIRVRTKDMNMKPYKPKTDIGIITLESKKEIDFSKPKSDKKEIWIERGKPTFGHPRKNNKAINVQTREFLFKPELKPKEPKVPEVELGKTILEGLEKKDGARVEPAVISEELELPNFFELLLGKGAAIISEGKPICIIVEKTKEKYEELLAVLCRDVYREKIGGKPMPIREKTIEDLRKDWNSLVERKIIIAEEVAGGSEELFKMLKSFFSQDIGFLILVTSEPFKLETEIRKEEPSANVITIGGLPPEVEAKREEILRLVRGKKSVGLSSFGAEFKKSVKEFEDELEKYLDYGKAPWELKRDWDKLTACSPDDNEQASDEHSAMKAFVWLYEWKKHKKQIIPELETEDKGIDVRVDDRNYEIETLFGVGDVMTKLTRKMGKYSKGEKVYFVLKNVDILRNLSLIASFRRVWRKAGYKVEFFGLDFDEQKLVPLEEFKNKPSLMKWN